MALKLWVLNCGGLVHSVPSALGRLIGIIAGLESCRDGGNLSEMAQMRQNNLHKTYTAIFTG